MLDDLVKTLDSLPAAKRKAIVEQAAAATKDKLFLPNPGAQLQAYFSRADELFYGGAAGGGKSALLCGLAVDAHRKSIIFRREYPQLKGLVDEVERIVKTRDGFNGDKLWRLPKGNELEFGAVQHEHDKEKYQGRAHDFVGFDEITHFTESQYRFLIGWTRSATPGSRARVVVAGNPPLTAEGQWVIRYWGPWLDPTYPRPAKPGELRWFTTVGGVDTEMDGPGPYLIDGREVFAKSRTFIGAKLEDNPDLLASGYAATVEAMPEPMRTMMREGRFDLAHKDSDWQVIPTAWIIAAEQRWTPNPPTQAAMTAMGLDPAGGGKDMAVLACRYGGWYGPLITAQGAETADGSSTAGTVVKHRRDGCPVVVDVGGGFGGAVSLRLEDNKINVTSFNGASASTAKTQDGTLHFVNKRAEAWWRFREALNPDQEGGSIIALPPDNELRADLASPQWKLSARGIQIESKDDIRSRLGRSPDRGDAVVMALSEGEAAILRSVRRMGTPPTVNLGPRYKQRAYR